MLTSSFQNCLLSFTLITMDPLEQFEVISTITIGGLSLFNNLGLILLLNLFVITSFFAMFNFNVLTTYDFVIKSLFQLVRSMAKENLYIKKQQYFTVLFYLFITLLLSNLIGLLPYSFTTTSSFILTLFLSLLHFIGVNTLGTSQHG